MDLILFPATLTRVKVTQAVKSGGLTVFLVSLYDSRVWIACRLHFCCPGGGSST